jgi:GntR family transcriptional regulator/MocR family aminotransferase
MSPLDRGSGPLHRQITARVALAIRRGAIAGGERLPSTRALSRALGVSRNTVIAAYEELVADGLIEGRHGAGMRVTDGAGARDRIARAIHVADPDGTPIAIVF